MKKLSSSSLFSSATAVAGISLVLAVIANESSLVWSWDLDQFVTGNKLTSFVKGRIKCFGNAGINDGTSWTWTHVAVVPCDEGPDIFYDAKTQHLFFENNQGVGGQFLLQPTGAQPDRVAFVPSLNEVAAGEDFASDNLKWQVDEEGRLKNIGDGKCAQVDDHDVPLFRITMEVCSDNPLQKVGTLGELPIPKGAPTIAPSASSAPSTAPSSGPTTAPTVSSAPTKAPSFYPSISNAPSSNAPSNAPSSSPSKQPTPRPTAPPTTYYVLPYVGKATATLAGNVTWKGKNASSLVDGTTSAEPSPPEGATATYESQSCEEPLDDLGFITIDLGESLDLDGVRVHMYQQPGQAYSYCNMYVSAWDEGENGPTVPIDQCPGRTSAPKTTEAPAAVEHLPPSKCYTCGDQSGSGSGRGCSRIDIFRPQNLHECSADKPYCMNDIHQDNSGQRTIYKRCVDENTCFKEWLTESSDMRECFAYNPNIHTYALVCHICCYGDGCNKSIFPDEDTRYKPNRRLAPLGNIQQDTTVYSSYCSTDYRVEASPHGIDFPIYPQRRVRFIRVWAGRSSVDSTVRFLEIQPLTNKPPTHAPSSEPSKSPTTDAPTKNPKAEPFTFTIEEANEMDPFAEMSDALPAPGPDPLTGTAAPTEAPAIRGRHQATSRGDPHFKTFSGMKYDFHGGCDLVLFDNANFASGLGLTVHIRTKIKTWWSHIEAAVVRVGESTLEVMGGTNGGQFWVNGEGQTFPENGDFFSLSGFQVNFHRVNKRTFRFRLDFGRGDAIALETFKDFVSVHINAKTDQFKGSVGLLGSFPEGKMLARDGKTILEDTDSFGKEWQVLVSEQMLFHAMEGPQHPQQCSMPDTTTAKTQRRRLGEALITKEDAAIACAHVDKDDQDACIFDVLATNDKEMAGSY